MFTTIHLLLSHRKPPTCTTLTAKSQAKKDTPWGPGQLPGYAKNFKWVEQINFIFLLERNFCTEIIVVILITSVIWLYLPSHVCTYAMEVVSNLIQWNLVIMRSLGPWKLPCYITFLIISGKKTKKYKEMGPAKLPCYKRVLL